jgi:DNA-binding transcriptional MerR regulator
MVDEQSLLIGELAERAGVSVRTIRYYIEEGLLPSPRVQGKYTVYDEEYIERIQLIRYLKDNYLPLREIRSMLDKLNGQEIKGLLEQYERGEAPQLPPASTPATGTSVGENSAVEYISNILQSRPNLNASAPGMVRSPQASPRAASPQPAPDPDNKLYQKSIFEKEAQFSPPLWRRLTLAPGVELHLQETEDRHLKHRIEKLIAFAEKLFR